MKQRCITEADKESLCHIHDNSDLRLNLEANLYPLLQIPANYFIVRGYVLHWTTIYKSSLGSQNKIANNTDRILYLNCAYKDCRGTAAVMKENDTLAKKREHNHGTET